MIHFKIKLKVWLFSATPVELENDYVHDLKIIVQVFFSVEVFSCEYMLVLRMV